MLFPRAPLGQVAGDNLIFSCGIHFSKVSILFLVFGPAEKEYLVREEKEKIKTKPIGGPLRPPIGLITHHLPAKKKNKNQKK